MATPLVLACFWIALSIWLGGVLFIAMAAPVIHKVCTDARPSIAGIRSVNLQEDHGTLLAGTVVGRLMKQLGTVQLVCGGVCLACMAGLLATGQVPDRAGGAVRVAVLLLATGVALWERFTVSPRMMSARDEFVLYSDEPELANPAKDRLDRLQETAARLLLVNAALLLAAVVLTASTPGRVSFEISPKASPTPAALPSTETRP